MASASGAVFLPLCLLHREIRQGFQQLHNQVLFHTLNGKALSLTPTEFSILRILCQKKGEVVSSEELFHEIWGDEYFSKSNNTITVHIRHLRKKMDDSFENPKYIKTVWGCGYKIEK